MKGRPIFKLSTLHRVLYLTVSILLLLYINGLAQVRHYTIRHYTSSNGLPQNSILQIKFDKDGYCWMATEAGLVRFDNKEFKTYAADNLPGLKDNRIHRLIITLQGRVFAKNLHGQEISTVPTNPLLAPAPILLPTSSPYYYPMAGYAIANTQIDTLWDALQKADSNLYVRKHYTCQNGDTYLVNKGSIYQILPHSSQLLRTWDTTPFSTAPVSGYLIQLWENSQVALWKSGQLLCVGKLHGTTSLAGALRKNSSALLWSPEGTFLFIDKCLYQISIDQNNDVTAKKVLTDLPFNKVSSIYYTAKNHTFYVGTPTKGLYIIKVSDFAYPTIPKSSGTTTFYAISKTSSDDLIVKNTVIPKNGTPYYLNLNTDQFRSFVDQQDWFYYKSGPNLYRYNLKSKIDELLMPLDENLAGILPGDSADALLVCTRKSLTKFSISQKAILWQKVFPINYSDESVNDFYHLQGSMYMLNTTQGAKWYNIQTGKIEKSILDSINLFSFYQDTKGRMWFGSDPNGIFLYQNNKVYGVHKKDIKKFTPVNAFIDDGHGYFWLATNNGLLKTGIDRLADYMIHDTAELSIYTFNTKDGLTTAEFNGATPNFQWLGDSTLALTSMDGVVEFKPSQLIIDHPDNRILIDKFTVDTTDLTLDLSGRAISISPGFKIINLQVNCPYFGNPDNIHLQYAIHRAGQPMIWQPLSPDGTIAITNLLPGAYQIMVRKAGTLKNQDDPLVIRLSVLPHFYNTWQFFLLVFVFIILICYLLFRIRLTRIKKEKQKIESIVKQRTEDLKMTAEQLRVSENDLRKSNQQKQQIITMIVHDLRSPLRFLKTITSGIMNAYQQEMSTNLSSTLNKLNGSASSLWEFTDRFFTWAITQQEDFEIQKTTFPLQEIFDTVASFYAEIVKLNDNQLLIHSTKIICTTDKNILLLIIRNIVDNANKNTTSGCITLKAATVDNHLLITIQDEGKGLSQNEMAMFMQKDRHSQISENKTGFGSQVIQTMVLKIDAHLFIESTSKGSTFTIRL